MISELFDAGLLTALSFSEMDVTFAENSMRPGKLEEGLVMRPLEIGDYDKGFVPLLSQLTVVGDVTKEKFEDRFREMQARKGTYYVVVVEDVACSKLVCCGTLLVELKFIHETSKRGHVEDIVVDQGYRGKQLGKIIIETLKKLSEAVGCYKVSLDCNRTNVGFYEKCGFQCDELHFMWKKF